MKNLQNLNQIAGNLPIFVNFIVKVKNQPFLGVFEPKISSEIQNFYLQPKSKICQFQINLQIWQH